MSQLLLVLRRELFFKINRSRVRRADKSNVEHTTQWWVQVWSHLMSFVVNRHILGELPSSNESMVNWFRNPVGDFSICHISKSDRLNDHPAIRINEPLILRKQTARPEKNDGWKTIFSFWNDPFWRGHVDSCRGNWNILKLRTYGAHVFLVISQSRWWGKNWSQSRSILKDFTKEWFKKSDFCCWKKWPQRIDG